MTDTERAWLAGLLEGEGCFTTTGKARAYGAVYLVSTDKDVVERAASLMDCNVHKLKHTSVVSVKSQYRAVVQGRKAGRVIEAVLPWLGARRAARAQEILNMIREG